MKPTISILRPGDEAALEAFLLPRVETSMFLIGNTRAAGLADHGERYQGTYAAAFESGEITAVVAHYWNQNLTLQAPVHLEELWEAAVQGSGRPVKGLIGPSDQVDAVKEAFHLDDSIIQMDETEKLYSLTLKDLIVPDNLRSGTVKGRRMEPRDMEVVTQWRVAYSLEALGEEDSPELREQCRASLERSLSEGHTWVLEAQGRPVACSSFNTAIKEAVQVGGVWTPPKLRRRGYGRAVVAASLLDAQAEGVSTAILFTGLENIAAQKAYEALGFEHIGGYRLLLLKTALEPAV
jgi:predicted GNAT family acetyltransferase